MDYNTRGEWKADLDGKYYKNPILYSDYSDPDAIKVGDDFFMTASSFTYFPGLPILHSKDLVNWKLVNYAIDRLPFEEYDRPAHGKGVWAPSIRYHNGEYYIFFATPDEGIFMTKTRDPFGKWDEVVCVKKASGWIDPCPFWDDDGKAYLVRGVAKSRIGYKSILFMHEMSPDGTKLLDDGVKVLDGRINHPTLEGPKIYKRNGYYYIFAPAGGVQTGWQVEARSKNIFGPYEHRVVLWQGGTEINGPHQGALIDLEDGKSAFLHFRDMNAYGRVIYLEPAKWVDDWCYLGVNINNEGIGEPVNLGSKPVKSEQGQNEPEKDDFKAKTLPWQWQAHYNDSFASYTENGLKLNAIKCEKENLVLAPNVMCRLIRRPEFIAELVLEESLTDGDSCGFVITGGSYNGVRVVKKDGKLTAYAVDYELTRNDSDICKKENRGEGLTLKSSGKLYLRLRMTYPGFVIPYISTDGEIYKILSEEKLFKVSRKSWVGGKIGVFCVSENENSKGFINCLSFEVF